MTAVPHAIASTPALPRHAPARTAVFQAGWAGVPDEWRQLPEADAAMWRAVLGIRSELNLLLEKARADKALGASLEAKVRCGPHLCGSARCCG